MNVYFDGYGDLQTVQCKLNLPIGPDSIHLMLVNLHLMYRTEWRNLFLSQKNFRSAVLLFTYTVLLYVLPAYLSGNFKHTYFFISPFKGWQYAKLHLNLQSVPRSKHTPSFL